MVAMSIFFIGIIALKARFEILGRADAWCSYREPAFWPVGFPRYASGLHNQVTPGELSISNSLRLRAPEESRHKCTISSKERYGNRFPSGWVAVHRFGRGDRI